MSFSWNECNFKQLNHVYVCNIRQWRGEPFSFVVCLQNEHDILFELVSTTLSDIAALACQDCDKATGISTIEVGSSIKQPVSLPEFN